MCLIVSPILAVEKKVLERIRLKPVLRAKTLIVSSAIKNGPPGVPVGRKAPDLT
jgi:hypothetical protein